MALNSIVGDPAAESYIAVADADTFHANLLNTAWAAAVLATKEAALRRATSYIDNVYRPRFVGVRTNRRLQALEWPRTGAYYSAPPVGDMPYGLGGASYSGLYGYDTIAVNAIPVEIANATCEAALREVTDPGSLNPDLEKGGAITHRLKAGSVEVEYRGGTSALTVYTAISRALSGLLTPANPYSANLGRA